MFDACKCQYEMHQPLDTRVTQIGVNVCVRAVASFDESKKLRFNRNISVCVSVQYNIHPIKRTLNAFGIALKMQLNKIN